MPTFDITVTRDGKWFMVAVPGLDGYELPDSTVNVAGLTQARHAGEVDQMAREDIATVLGVPVDAVAVRSVGNNSR